jgi:hypothetical protein
MRGEKQIDITNSHHFPSIHQLQYQINDIFDIGKTATSTSTATSTAISQYKQTTIEVKRSIEATASHQLQVGAIKDDRSESINQSSIISQ